MRSLALNIRTFVLALVLGVSVWVSAVSAADPDEEHAYPRPIPIEIVGQEPSLMLTGDVPTHMDVTLRAPRSVWERLTTQENAVRAILDLSGLDAGEHTVDIQIQVSPRPTQILFANPSAVTVNLESLENRTLPLTLSLSGQPAAGFRAGEGTLAEEEVVISGPTSLVAQAVRARVMVNLDGVRENMEEPIAIQIMDAKNEIIRGLTINPETVVARVPITQQGGFRELAVRVVVRGEQAAGYRLENISVSPLLITVFSTDRALVNSLPGVVDTQPLDLQDAKEDISTRLSLDLPDNVTLVGAQTVQVQVSITPIQTSLTLLSQPINIVGLAAGLSAETFPETVDVIISGPLPVLDVLASQDVVVTVNVAGLGVGTHQLKPDVQALIGNVLVESVLPGTVEVVLSIANTPAPMGTP